MFKQLRPGSVYIACIWLLQLVVTPAHAEQWRVLTELLPPLQVMQGDKLTGTAVEQVNTLLKQSGIDAPIEVFPWARAYEIAKTRPNTLIFSVVRNEVRESQFHWIGVLGEIRFSFIALTDREEVQINSTDDAKGWVLGTVRNDFVHNWLLQDGFTKDEHFVIRSELSQLVDLLYKGLIDGLLVNKEVIKIIAQQQGYDPTRIRAWYQPPELSMPLYLAANIDSDKARIKQLKRYFTLLKN